VLFPKLADGLHLIDFEQLKIENQTLNEKIEERNEELHKLRKKTTTTVQVLTHIKEKLQFCQAENRVLKENLAELDADLTEQRERLARAKNERDELRLDNDDLMQRQGFVNNDALVQDYEQRKLDMQDLRDQMEQLQARHEFLSAQVAGAGGGKK
jgi:chromosome segregation ATPase